MKHYRLHEIAKFFAGLVLGDFLCLWWLSAHHGLPIQFLGITWTQSIVAPGLIFDAALFIILIHYGWHIGKTPALRSRAYFLTAGVVFGIVAFAHLVRLFTGASIVLLGWSVPLWLSWIGVTVTAYLSYMSFRLATQWKK